MLAIGACALLAPALAPAAPRAALTDTRVSVGRIEHPIRPGDCFAGILAGYGVPSDEIGRWAQAARPYANLSHLEPGRAVRLEFDSAGRLRALRYDVDDERAVAVERGAGGAVTARGDALPVIVRTVAARAVVERTFFQAARGAAIPDAIVSQMVDVLSWKLTFKSDVHRGDVFRVLYEDRTAPTGRPLKPGRIVAVEYAGRTGQMAAYLYGEEAGEPVYVDGEGHRLNGAPLRYPVEFTRITSTFSQARFHPILLQSRPHRGVDFAAPAGTPVRAIGAGTVQWAGAKGGFGNHVELDHGADFVSAYSHLQAIDPAIAVGSRVARGQLLGWVGQTGLATGPHLHFATFDHGEYVDPLTVKLPLQLSEIDPKTFRRFRDTMQARLRGSRPRRAVAPSAPELVPPLAMSAVVGPIHLTF